MRCVLSPIESSFVVFFLSRSLAEDWYGPLIPLPISRGSGALSQQVTGDAAPEEIVAKNTKITAAEQKQFASISYFLAMMMLVVMMIGCDSLVKHKSEAAAVSASEADLAQQEKSHRGTDQRFCSWQIWHCNGGDDEVFGHIFTKYDCIDRLWVSFAVQWVGNLQDLDVILAKERYWWWFACFGYFLSIREDLWELQ